MSHFSGTEAHSPPSSGIPSSCWPRFVSHLVVLGVCLSILFAAASLTPAASPGGALRIGPLTLPSLCTFRNLTGLPCPGCGLSRSLVSTLRGDFSSGWKHHRLGFLTLAYILFQFFFRLGAILIPSTWSRVFPSERGLNLGLAALGFLFAVNWILTLSGV